MAYKRISPTPVVEGGTSLQTITAHNLIVGNGTGTPALVAPSATSGVAVVSAGAAADPVYGTVSVSGGGTGLTSVTAHDLLIGNGTSALTLLAPSATSGVPVVSAGASADPVYGTASVSGGGTGLTSLTAHDLIIGNGTSAATLLAPSATAGIPLVSAGSSADPAYSTAVVAGGGTGNTTFTAYSVICAGTTSTGAFQNVSGLGSSGQVLTSNGASALPSWQAAGGGGGMTWTEVTGTSQSMAVNNGYILNNASLVTATLPATAAVGSIVAVVGKGAGGWAIAQNSGDQIHFGNVNTTSGVGGSLASTNQYDCVELICTVANDEWVVRSSIGNITYV